MEQRVEREGKKGILGVMEIFLYLMAMISQMHTTFNIHGVLCTLNGRSGLCINYMSFKLMYNDHNKCYKIKIVSRINLRIKNIVP